MRSLGSHQSFVDSIPECRIHLSLICRVFSAHDIQGFSDLSKVGDNDGSDIFLHLISNLAETLSPFAHQVRKKPVLSESSAYDIFATSVTASS